MPAETWRQGANAFCLCHQRKCSLSDGHLSPWTPVRAWSPLRLGPYWGYTDPTFIARTTRSMVSMLHLLRDRLCSAQGECSAWPGLSSSRGLHQHPQLADTASGAARRVSMVVLATPAWSWEQQREAFCLSLHFFN